MKILVLNGSPRPQGNTMKMITAFSEGAASAGHQVDIVDVCKKKITGCLACEYCHTKGNGACIQKDDMQEIYDLLKEAEMLVVASPIYYHGISGQLKCAIDRFYAAAYPLKPPHLKKAAMFLSSGDDKMYDGAMFSYQGDFLDYLGLENMGVFTAHGYENGSKEKLNEIRNFGSSLK
ncbi:flavodoxin family protein [Diplocloster agilis]|uniref:Flavodoxin family protein n=1 Tax=Diplocloster agilis TaxID=2850323 RepID=A0A949K3J2_9FIRM|nr:flavodoxin family protein [Diplocloster agilis]MBU9738115.1 flavodoxin family protein [Diplocloster agilis]